ncbi:MAG: hypothetical protein RLZZ172_2999, partial [Bacteroidota bacterium]
MRFNCKLSAFAFLFLIQISFAQDQQGSKYDPNVLFNPVFYSSYGNNIRTGNGEPGNGYWQNRADYQIKAELNDSLNRVSGSVTMTYTNNSPHNLAFLWFQLEQNLFNPESRGFAKLPPAGRSRYGNAANPFEGGYTISSVKLITSTSGKTAETVLIPEITDTRMRVELPKALKPAGDKVT